MQLRNIIVLFMTVPLKTYIDERRNITGVDLYNPLLYHKKQSRGRSVGLNPKAGK